MKSVLRQLYVAMMVAGTVAQAGCQFADGDVTSEAVEASDAELTLNGDNTDAVKDSRCGRSCRSASAVVQDFYDKLGQGDLPGMLENFAEDATWVLYGPSGIPFAGVHEGREGIKAFIETFGASAQVTRFEPKEFVAGQHKVVVHGYEEATAVPTGKSWQAHWTHSFTVERGKIVRVREVLDTAPVLAAFQ